jgi:hypothetical protein
MLDSLLDTILGLYPIVALVILVPISGLACHLVLASILLIIEHFLRVFLCLSSTQGSGEVPRLETWIPY